MNDAARSCITGHKITVSEFSRREKKIERYRDDCHISRVGIHRDLDESQPR